MKKLDVLGLPVQMDDNGALHIEGSNLIEWMSSRDAACAEYLVPALRRCMETKQDVKE